MKKLTARICGVAAFAIAATSCLNYDMEGYEQTNDAMITEPVTDIDIEWRDASVEIGYEDIAYIRIYDNGDATNATWFRVDDGVLYIKYSDNNYTSYDKSLAIVLPMDLVLNSVNIDVTSSEVYADVDAKYLDIDSNSGNVTYSTWYDPTSVDINDISGDVNLYLPADCGFTCRFDTTSGTYTSEFGLMATTDRLVFGDGRSDIAVHTLSGNLALRINE